MNMKRKRKVIFHTNIEIDQTTKKQKKYKDTDLFSGEYTFDSDEREDKNMKPINQDDLNEIEQERARIDFDDNIKINSFNADEEMEEGQYDEINSTNVKNYKLKNSQALDDLSKNNDEDEDNEDDFNEINALKSLLTRMQPNETVIHAIKRFGIVATSNKSKQRIKQRKPFFSEISTILSIESTSEELKKNKLLLEEMTGLADQFISHGQLDIYQETYEQLKTKLDHLQSSISTSLMINQTFDNSGMTSSVINDRIKIVRT